MGLEELSITFPAGLDLDGYEKWVKVKAIAKALEDCGKVQKAKNKLKIESNERYYKALNDGLLLALDKAGKNPSNSR